VADQSTDKIEGSIEASRDATAGDDAESTELELSTSGVALTTSVALLEREAALASVAGTTTRLRVGAAANVGAIFLFVDVEAKIVDHIALFHDIEALGHVAMGYTLIHVLHLDHVVGVGCDIQSRKNASLGNEKRAGADRHESSLSHGVLGLNIGISLDQSHGLGGCVLAKVGNSEHVVGTSTRDNDNVVVGEFLVGLAEGHVGLERDALRRGDEFRVADEGDFERLAFYENWSVTVCVVEEHVMLEVQPTRVIDIVTSMAENFKRTDEIEGVKAWVEGEQDLDGLGHSAITVLCDCTHRNGIVMWVVKR
jgi:hypothetical protein